MPRDQHVHLEWRGGTCRVKWWSGEYLPNGRKRYESKGGFTDEDEAYQHGLDKLYEIRHGTHVKNRDAATLMADWVDEWLTGLDHGHLTERGYRYIAKKHIRPYFADRRTAIGEVDILAYRAFRKHVYGLMSEGSARNVMTLLNMMLDDAVPRLIKTSPVERKRSRGRYVKKRVRERKRDMSVEAVELLSRNAEALLGPSGRALIWTMATTCMRPGELYGLTREYCYPNWPASDPRESEEESGRYEDDLLRYGVGPDRIPAIRVQRQVQFGDAGLDFYPPKYGSFRTLAIPPFLASMLDSLLKSHDSDWVFPALRGGSLGGLNFNTMYWRLIADGAPAKTAPRMIRPYPKLDPVPAFAGKRMYLIRHGGKAWLDEDGHSRFAVESRMGHEVPGVEGTYSSVTVPMERAIMKTLQARWDSLHGKP
ncbi:integrase [Streptomyces sp. NPDC088925]|uniref:integrase n=1 Tax=Streptomyces sp. NPDC088925 TaxID=3365914 RepID=UPI00380D5ABB